MRFRITELIVFVSAAALTVNCLVKPDEMHETIFVSFTLIAILVSIAMAIGSAKAQKSFWISFSVIAVSYLAFAHIPDVDENCPRQYGPEFTTQVLAWAFYEADDPFAKVDNPFADEMNEGMGESQLTIDSTDEDPFGDDPFGDDPFKDGNSPADDPMEAAETIADGDIPLITAIQLLVEEVEPDRWVDTGSGLGTIKPYTATTICVVGTGEPEPFFRIGHSAWALLLGWFAGHLAQFVYFKTHSQ